MLNPRLLPHSVLVLAGALGCTALERAHDCSGLVDIVNGGLVDVRFEAPDAGDPDTYERFAATYACRAAIKAGEVLTEQEMRGLVTRLFACALPPHDVHGRASMVQLPREELERRFGRR